MGENKHIEELDAFSKKYIKEVPKSTPSGDFTKNVMQHILQEKSVYDFSSTPLISKKVWVAILAIFTSALGVVVFSDYKSSFSLPEFHLSWFSNLEFTSFFETIAVSPSTTYAFVLFGVMILIQIFYLKQYFNSRIS